MRPLLILLSALYISSCELEQYREINLDQGQPQFVVQGIIDNSLPFAIRLNKSASIADENTLFSDPYTLKHEFTAKLYDNDTLISTLTKSDDIPLILLEVVHNHIEGYNTIKPTNYYKPDEEINTVVGREYSIEIQSSVLPSVQCSATQMHAIDFGSFHHDTIADNYRYKNSVRINDPSEEENYYSIMIKNEMPYRDSSDTRFQTASYDFLEYINTGVEDNLFSQFYDRPYPYLLFSDKELNPETGVYEFYNGAVLNSPNKIDSTSFTFLKGFDMRRQRVSVVLNHISKQTYYYLLELLQQEYDKRDPFAQPHILDSNIEGGLGLFSLPGSSEIIYREFDLSSSN